MKIETVFSCGDKGFVVTGHFGSEIQELTVGQVRVEVTSSPGLDGMNQYTNYAACEGYKEQVMCIETGVGSGSVWTAGENIFKTREDAVEGQKKIRETYSKAIADQEAYKARRKAEDIARYKRELARLEAEE